MPTINSFASTTSVNTTETVDFTTINAELKGLQFWFEDSGVPYNFPKWSAEAGACSFLRITTNATDVARRGEFLYPICPGMNYISFEHFNSVVGTLTFTYNQTALKTLTLAPMRLLPPLPPLPGVDPRTPPLPPLK